MVLIWTPSALRTYQSYSTNSPQKRAFDQVLGRIEEGQDGKSPADLGVKVDSRLPSSSYIDWEPAVDSDGALLSTCVVAYTRAIPDGQDGSATILVLWEHR